MPMAESTQSYKKHTRFLPPFHFFVMPVLLVNVLNELRYLYQEGLTRHHLFQAVLGAALVMGALMARVQALTVQDRVIRLEMRLRLRGLLPPDLHPSIEMLTHRQLVALRFASDAEMADLVREVLTGKLSTSKDIKSKIRSWQADWLRA
jgi:hypothetical protein